MRAASHTVSRDTAATVERIFDVVVAEDVLPKVLHRWGPIPAVTGTRDLTGPWDTPGLAQDGRARRRQHRPRAGADLGAAPPLRVPRRRDHGRARTQRRPRGRRVEVRARRRRRRASNGPTRSTRETGPGRSCCRYWPGAPGRGTWPPAPTAASPSRKAAARVDPTCRSRSRLARRTQEERAMANPISKVFEQVNKSKDWWELPVPAALLNLARFRDELRQFNLYDTEAPENGGGATTDGEPPEVPHLRRLADRPGRARTWARRACASAATCRSTSTYPQEQDVLRPEPARGHQQPAQPRQLQAGRRRSTCWPPPGSSSRTTTGSATATTPRRSSSRCRSREGDDWGEDGR